MGDGNTKFPLNKESCPSVEQAPPQRLDDPLPTHGGAVVAIPFSDLGGQMAHVSISLWDH